jgi:hypothetical protein
VITEASLERGSLAEKMQVVLFEMKWLLPWGTVTNYNPTGGGGVADSKIPAGVRLEGRTEEMPHELWKRHWDHTYHSPRQPQSCDLCARGNSQTGSHGRERVYRAAKEDLVAWRKRPAVHVVEETSDDQERRMIREGCGWEPKAVAVHFNCTPTYVRRVRVAAGVNADTGQPTAGVSLDTMDEVEKAQQMAHDGLTERQIRMILNCGSSKVRRLLGRAT